MTQITLDEMSTLFAGLHHDVAATKSRLCNLAVSTGAVVLVLFVNQVKDSEHNGRMSVLCVGETCEHKDIGSLKDVHLFDGQPKYRQTFVSWCPIVKGKDGKFS